MNVLVLHNIEDLSRARRSTLDHIYCFERYAPEHNYLYHRIMNPVTDALRTAEWDLVIFESTSLGIVTLRPRQNFQHLREAWTFLRKSSALKIAFPQDDATHSAFLDYFFFWLGIDIVFSVRPERREQLYPLSSKSAEFVATVAGYIDDRSLDELTQLARPWSEREWVVGQRVTMYPAWGGRFARRKSMIAVRFHDECVKRGLRENVSTESGEVFLGDDWYRFLGDCQFVVGAEGGHGLWDPHGVIQDEVNDYVSRFPDASFEEVEDNCFYGLDGRDSFPGFPPRILEAAMMGCGQILLEGKYRGFIEPGKHYLEVRDDYSNLDEIFIAMQDKDRVAAMIRDTWSALVENPAFRYSTLVNRVFELPVSEKRSSKFRLPFGLSNLPFRLLRSRHNDQLASLLREQLRPYAPEDELEVRLEHAMQAQTPRP